jgi:PKD repeat protein
LAAETKYDGSATSQIVSYRVETSGDLVQVAASPASPGVTMADGAVMAITPNQGPVASFSAHPIRRSSAGPVVLFDARSSEDADGYVARYDWDFGDGTKLLNAGPVATHRFHQGHGRYQVTLTVTDNEACSFEYIGTGKVTLCNGGPAAKTSRSVWV